MAAAAIQGAWRSHRLRQQLTRRLIQARQERNDHFQRLQLRLQQQWTLFQRQTHVVIHVPSIQRRQPLTMAQASPLEVPREEGEARLLMKLGIADIHVV